MDDNFVDLPIVDIIFSILRDPNRRRILSLIEKHKLTANQIKKQLKITRPAVEKHLKQMLKIGFIERSAETIPNLHYVYSLPDHTVELLSQVQDAVDDFTNSMEETYSLMLEKEEHLFLLGLSSKERYETVKKGCTSILTKMSIKNEK